MQSSCSTSSHASTPHWFHAPMPLWPALPCWWAVVGRSCVALVSAQVSSPPLGCSLLSGTVLGEALEVAHADGGGNGQQAQRGYGGAHLEAALAWRPQVLSDCDRGLALGCPGRQARRHCSGRCGVSPPHQYLWSTSGSWALSPAQEHLMRKGRSCSRLGTRRHCWHCPTAWSYYHQGPTEDLWVRRVWGEEGTGARGKRNGIRMNTRPGQNSIL